tara:strand:+ start:1059 stop:1256 length:198 start_codon:yes stop_codon:yes gene_type:complete
MIALFLIPLFFGITNADALDTFKKEQDKGAEWHYVGGQPLDPKSVQVFDINGDIYWKLKYKEEVK